MESELMRWSDSSRQHSQLLTITVPYPWWCFPLFHPAYADLYLKWFKILYWYSVFLLKTHILGFRAVNLNAAELCSWELASETSWKPHWNLPWKIFFFFCQLKSDRSCLLLYAYVCSITVLCRTIYMKSWRLWFLCKSYKYNCHESWTASLEHLT